jgi:hypothetical protein
MRWCASSSIGCRATVGAGMGGARRGRGGRARSWIPAPRSRRRRDRQAARTRRGGSPRRPGAGWGCRGTAGGGCAAWCCRTACVSGSRWSSGTPTAGLRRWVPMVICSGSLMPCLPATASTKPTIRSTAVGGSCSRARVRARKNMASESAEPSIAGYSDGSTARTRSRLTRGNSRMRPLWTHSQRPWRKGWAVCLLNGRAGGGADVGQEQWRGDVAGQLPEVAVAPGRADGAEHSRGGAYRRGSSPRPARTLPS